MRKTLILLALTCLPGLANIPFGETTVIDNLNSDSTDLWLAAAWIPSTSRVGTAGPGTGSQFSIQDKRETPDYVIVYSHHRNTGQRREEYTVLQKWSENGYKYCTVLIPLTSAPVAITNLMIATMSKGEVHNAT